MHKFRGGLEGVIDRAYANSTQAILATVSLSYVSGWAYFYFFESLRWLSALMVFLCLLSLFLLKVITIAHVAHLKLREQVANGILTAKMTAIKTEGTA